MRKRIVAALALASACGGLPEDQLETMSEDLTQCAGRHTLQGIDVSVWQGHIDWNAVARSGRAFAIARISDGFYMDDTFQTNYAAIKRVGMVRGAYQFFNPRQNAVAQADIVVRAIGGKLSPGDLPPTLDVEVTDGVGPAAIAAGVKAWSDRIVAKLGRRPMIYSGSYFWDDHVKSGAVSHDPLWLPAWGISCPRLPAAWSSWTIHQYTSDGHVPGISGRVDLDLYDGTRAELEKLAGKITCDSHCDGSTAVGANCARSDCSAHGAHCVDDSLGARCVAAGCPARGEAQICLNKEDIAHCKDGAITGRGDCGAYGAYCSTAGATAHTARCVSSLCVDSASDAPEAHDACTIHGEKLHCDANGAPKSTACAAGKQCSVVGGVHCGPAVCPAKGKSDACISEHAIGHCEEASVVGSSDCGAHAYCTTAGNRAAHCASDVCVKGPQEVPVAHDLCLADGRVGHCGSGGGLHAETCAAGTECRAGACQAIAVADAGTVEGEPDAGSGSADAGPDTGPADDAPDAGDSQGGPSLEADPDAASAGCTSAGASPFALILLAIFRARASSRRP